MGYWLDVGHDRQIRVPTAEISAAIAIAFSSAVVARMPTSPATTARLRDASSCG
jgi:hypothetical protein